MARMFLARIAAVGIALSLCGCSWLAPAPQGRGNHVDADQLKELTPGVSTRADVTAVIGSPTAKATFDDNTWLYISEQTQPRIGRTQAVVGQQVVVLSFNEQGILQNVDVKDQADAMPVSVIARTTASPGTEAGFLRQLFGNIGRFSAGTPSPAMGGGAPKPY